MSKIKEGTLVKAWFKDSDEFVIGRYCGFVDGYYLVDDFSDDYWYADFVIEIPADLAKQLEDLGR
jgi:hypothetical protein